MKTNTLLMIGVGAVALYFLTKKPSAASTPYVPALWQGPIYQPTPSDIAVDSLKTGIETGIWAGIHTLPFMN